MRTVTMAKISASSTLAPAKSSEMSRSREVRRSISACAAFSLRYSASSSRATTLANAPW